jgi:catechol 2,3-dioxygenase-like lactoylglutathione lyase family enzyme
MRHALAIGLLGALMMSIAATAALAEIPATLRPKRIAGPGINVHDLEGQRAWYQDKLGMRVVDTVRRDGKPFEYIMGYEGSGAILALLHAPDRPAGANHMSRLILLVPDAKALADHLAAQGIAPREVLPNAAYFIDDPEGNPVELYTPPAPAK